MRADSPRFSSLCLPSCALIIFGLLLTAGPVALAQNAAYGTTETKSGSIVPPFPTAGSGNVVHVDPQNPNGPVGSGITPQPGMVNSSGIVVGVPSGSAIPNPPPASAFSGNADQLVTQAALQQAQAEQAALQAQAQAEADEANREHEHNLKSYDRAAAGLLPLSPDQVREFMHKLEQTQEASVPPFAGQPKGQVRIATLSLDPGVDPPVINLASGYVTTINMVDATGEPWPILDVGVGGSFEVSPTQAGTHIVRVMPLTRVGMGDLSVLLKDLPTPVIFRLQAGGPTVDLRYDARVGKMGPGAKAPLIDRPHLEAGNEAIMLILANAPPSGAKRMKIAGLDGRSMAWMLDNKVYVRSPLTLLSPAWNASASSADGMTVYEIGDAPVLLMSDNGAIVRAHLVRDDDHDK